MSVSNFVRATIKNSVSDSATSIDVDTASSPFNNPPAPDDHARLFLVDSLDSPTKWEEIEYTGRTAITGGYTLTGVTRNEDSNTGSAQSFDAGHFVVMQPSATTDGQGAIVDSGTGANGSYIRYENGEQICWTDVVTMAQVATSVLQYSWTFPAAFNSTPNVTHTPTGSVSGLSTGGQAALITTNSPGTSIVNLRMVDNDNNPFGASDEMDTMGVARGFWK